ncbi:MAG: DMT family transporter [Acetobacteraceae bacterium]|nr:DMT family transporter [Acetobacteraceae bacterium]
MSIKLASGLDDFGRARCVEGLVLLLFTACSWGLNWPVMKFLLTELPPFTMRAVSGGLGLVIAVAIALWRRESLHLPRSQVLNVIVFAMLNYGVFGLLTVLALYWMRASEAVVITYTLPIWTMMLAWPILGERPNPPGIIGMILAIGGIAWLVGADEIRLRATMLPGVACGFLARSVLAWVRSSPNDGHSPCRPLPAWSGKSLLVRCLSSAWRSSSIRICCA